MLARRARSRTCPQAGPPASVSSKTPGSGTAEGARCEGRQLGYGAAVLAGDALATDDGAGEASVVGDGAAKRSDDWMVVGKTRLPMLSQCMTCAGNRPDGRIAWAWFTRSTRPSRCSEHWSRRWDWLSIFGLSDNNPQRGANSALAVFAKSLACAWWPWGNLAIEMPSWKARTSARLTPPRSTSMVSQVMMISCTVSNCL